MAAQLIKLIIPVSIFVVVLLVWLVGPVAHGYLLLSAPGLKRVPIIQRLPVVAKLGASGYLEHGLLVLLELTVGNVVLD